MNLFINDLPCEAAIGQTLGKAARVNHSHVGYVCAGQGICQACYVTVQEGADSLSPLSDVEKAFLSDRQIAKGGRLACQAVIERDGVVKVLSRPEEVRRMLFNNPVALFGYGAEMGRDTASRILPGIANLAGRAVRGELGGKSALPDFLEGVGAAFQLAVTTAPKMIPFGDQFRTLLSAFPIPVPFFNQPAIVAKTGLVSLPVSVSGTPLPIALPVPDAIIEKPDLAALEGISEAQAIKLIKAGVKTLDMLLLKGADRKGRKLLADETALSEEEVLTLVNRADLARIKGIGVHYSELLEAAGVDTVPELAQRNAANLMLKLQDVNKSKKLVLQLPTAEQVKDWVQQAKTLRRMVTY
ncbi:DUF4332 domain-containing protein [Chlorobium phaeobacteroides]|uniref:Ferredoxin n=1 Tax=Chlorobium phaeobacteroides (strain DSM 266 / SMG 266 / 2430) TaxID=290317 RepID=A1BH73_CHLPD|nr:DUF4332 domain-containing protein [Chlorobium phaeobacteroides]ABL65750.1 ferredoxin [Chlorobium phaeobacteroides DSM 266]